MFHLNRFVVGVFFLAQSARTLAVVPAMPPLAPSGGSVSVAPPPIVGPLPMPSMLPIFIAAPITPSDVPPTGTITIFELKNYRLAADLAKQKDGAALILYPRLQAVLNYAITLGQPTRKVRIRIKYPSIMKSFPTLDTGFTQEVTGANEFSEVGFPTGADMAGRLRFETLPIAKSGEQGQVELSVEDFGTGQVLASNKGDVKVFDKLTLYAGATSFSNGAYQLQSKGNYGYDAIPTMFGQCRGPINSQPGIFPFYVNIAATITGQTTAVAAATSIPATIAVDSLSIHVTNNGPFEVETVLDTAKARKNVNLNLDTTYNNGGLNVPLGTMTVREGGRTIISGNARVQSGYKIRNMRSDNVVGGDVLEFTDMNIYIDDAQCANGSATQQLVFGLVSYFYEDGETQDSTWAFPLSIPLLMLKE